jgi:hypothetical protein
MTHGKTCSCARCWADREARAFAEHERRVARRRTWKPVLGSIWTGRRSVGSFGPSGWSFATHRSQGATGCSYSTREGCRGTAPGGRSERSRSCCMKSSGPGSERCRGRR